MPAAMLYVLVPGPVANATFLDAARTAAGTAPVNLTPGPWTSAQVTVPVEVAPDYSFTAAASPTAAQQTAANAIGRDPLSAAQRAAIALSAGMVQNGWGLWGTSGPFAGVNMGDLSPGPGGSRPAGPPSVLVSAFKQAFISSAAVPSSWRGTLASRIANALHATTAAAAPWGAIPAGDRGVPSNPIYTEGGSAGGGLLVGIIAIAAVAAMASRGTSRQKAMAGLGISRNRERMSFPEWAYAAGMNPRKAKPGAHAAWVRGEDPSEWRMGAKTRAVGAYR